MGRISYYSRVKRFLQYGETLSYKNVMLGNLGTVQFLHVSGRISLGETLLRSTMGSCALAAGAQLARKPSQWGWGGPHPLRG